jgi:hypothetical protein
MPKREPAKFLLRLDPDVMAAVKRWAEAELRSVNGQIEFLLRQALAARGVKVGEAEGDAESADEKAT